MARSRGYFHRVVGAVTNYDVSAGVTFEYEGRKDGRVIQHRGRRTTPICGGPSSRMGRRIRRHGVNIYKGDGGKSTVG